MRWTGSVVVVIASLWAVRAPSPDVLMSSDCTALAVHGADGRLCRCNASGCIARLADGKFVSQVITPDAFEEDCRFAAVVVTSRELPGECKAIVIDRKLSRGNGAIALRENGDGFEIRAARPAGQDRPWARGSAALEETAAAAAMRSQPRDATPRADDLEAGD